MAAGPEQDSAPESELGSVVLRGESKNAGGLRPLRPLAFALVLLVLLDVTLRIFLPPDPRVLRDPLHPYGCFREDDLARLAAARSRDPGGVDVVLLGDSVLSATNNPAGERVEDFLLPELRQRLGGGPLGERIRVWNLGRGGAHAADLYGALLELGAAVPGGGSGGLFVVLDTNIIFFSRRHASPAMLYPCLADFFPGNPDGRGLRASLKVPAGPGAVERHLTGWATRGFYLYQQRRRIDQALFGGPPRDALRDRLLVTLGRLRLRPGPAQIEVSDPNVPWSRRGLTADRFAASYDRLPFASPEAMNYRVSQRLAALLSARQREWPSFVFLTPQNHGLLGSLVDNPGYHKDTTAIGAIFSGAGVHFRSYDGQVDPGLFTDLDHLSADGNRRLAALLSEDLVPRLLARYGPPSGQP